MRIVMFSAKPYDVDSFSKAAEREGRHELVFVEAPLNADTAVLARDAVACAFVNDCLNDEVMEQLSDMNVTLVALRSAGYNQVDLAAAAKHGVVVVRVPDYSPHAVAEHCIGLILSLNRKIHRAYNRVRENNFSLDGLLGFDLKGKTIGIVGTGRIGAAFAQICSGFGMDVVATDPSPDPGCRELGVRYCAIEELLSVSDIVTLHCPLNTETDGLMSAERLALMKPGAMLINTSRGGLIDTAAAIDCLKTGQLGYLGLDVYEEESELFFVDRSDRVVTDDVFSRLLTLPNVLVTGHQGFFTSEALSRIAETTLASIGAYQDGGVLEHQVAATEVRGAPASKV